MKPWLRVGISATVLGALLVLLPWDEFTDALGRLPPVVWLGVLAGFLGGHFLGVFKWRRMVNAGRALLGPTDALRCYAAGLFANLCLPSIVGGDVLRAALASRTTGRSEASVIGSIADRLSDILALGLIVGVAATLVRTRLPGWGPQLLGVGLLAGVGAAALFAPLALRRPLAKWPRRVRRPLGRALVALRRVARQPATAASVLAMSLTIQCGFVLLNAWIGGAVGVEVPLAAWFFAWPMAKVAGLVPISLGGLGVRDATFGAVMAPFGVPIAEGVAVSLIWQSVLIAGGLVAGGVWTLLGRDGVSLGSIGDVVARRPVRGTRG